MFLKLMGPLGLELISYIYIIMSFALELLWSQILQLGYANLFLEMLESLDKIQLLEDVFVFFPARPHPMVLPHKLIPYLWSKGLWPHHKPRELTRYWNHIRCSGKSPLGEVSPESNHIPLWFWGDGAQVNNQFSVVVLAIGACLDQRSFSMDFCFPLTFVREEPSP